MITTLDQLRRYLGGLTVYLRNFGVTVPDPTLDRYPSGEVGFEFTAILPGSDQPRPAVVRVGEIWEPSGDAYERAEYLYDLIEHPLDRRRGFHSHDAAVFARRFGVLVHEHCEEALGRPTCHHHHGIPIANGYEALERLLSTWGQPGPLGCAALRCIDFIERPRVRAGMPGQKVRCCSRASRSGPSGRARNDKIGACCAGGLPRGNARPTSRG